MCQNMQEKIELQGIDFIFVEMWSLEVESISDFERLNFKNTPKKYPKIIC
jgi:hypothetical protein